MKPMEALSTMAYISDRTWEGTIYTISDIRYPDYNGKRILVKIKVLMMKFNNIVISSCFVFNIHNTAQIRAGMLS